MKVYRAILTTNVDVNNIGCHTSKCYKSAISTAEGSNSYKYKKQDDEKLFLIWISVKDFQINDHATCESNTNYSHEKEVVLMPNEVVNIQIWCDGELVYKGKGNTGNRYDKWVESFL